MSALIPNLWPLAKIRTLELTGLDVVTGITIHPATGMMWVTGWKNVSKIVAVNRSTFAVDSTIPLTTSDQDVIPGIRGICWSGSTAIVLFHPTPLNAKLATFSWTTATSDGNLNNISPTILQHDSMRNALAIDSWTRPSGEDELVLRSDNGFIIYDLSDVVSGTMTMVRHVVSELINVKGISFDGILCWHLNVPPETAERGDDGEPLADIIIRARNLHVHPTSSQSHLIFNLQDSEDRYTGLCVRGNTVWTVKAPNTLEEWVKV